MSLLHSNEIADPNVEIVKRDGAVYVNISFPVVYEDSFPVASEDEELYQTYASYTVFIAPDGNDLFVGMEDGQQFDGEQEVYGNHLMFARLARAI
jgi:hypothetical protein